MDKTKLTNHQILQADLTDWRQLAQALHARFVTGDFASGLRFVTAVGEVAEAADHHPDVWLTYPFVDLRLASHDVGALTSRDVNLARQISEIAHDQQLTADPRAVAQVEVGLDTADHTTIGPFWAALLTGSGDALHDNEILDPGGRVPNLWFQGTDAHETPRQRFHLDLWVAADAAQERIAAAVAAGGRVVGGRPPSFTVLQDPDGNNACVCTSLDR